MERDRCDDCWAALHRSTASTAGSLSTLAAPRQPTRPPPFATPTILVAGPSAESSAATAPTPVAGPSLVARPSLAASLQQVAALGPVCTNCGVKTKNGPLCKYCKDLPCCRQCRRCLPATKFCTSDPTLCQCCYNKRKYKSLQALGHVVTEVPLPTADTDCSFDEYLDQHRDEIQQIVGDYHRQLR